MRHFLILEVILFFILFFPKFPREQTFFFSSSKTFKPYQFIVFLETSFSGVLFFFSFFGLFAFSRAASCGMWRFPGQGSNWNYSCWPTPGPQQRGIQATSATYTTTHGNAGSSTHWAKPGVKPEIPWFLVGFVNHCATTGTPGVLFLKKLPHSNCLYFIDLFHVSLFTTSRILPCIAPELDFCISLTLFLVFHGFFFFSFCTSTSFSSFSKMVFILMYHFHTYTSD